MKHFRRVLLASVDIEYLSSAHAGRVTLSIVIRATDILHLRRSRPLDRWRSSTLPVGRVEYRVREPLLEAAVVLELLEELSVV